MLISSFCPCLLLHRIRRLFCTRPACGVGYSLLSSEMMYSKLSSSDSCVNDGAAHDASGLVWSSSTLLQAIHDAASEKRG